MWGSKRWKEAESDRVRSDPLYYRSRVKRREVGVGEIRMMEVLMKLCPSWFRFNGFDREKIERREVKNGGKRG